MVDRIDTQALDQLGLGRRADAPARNRLGQEDFMRLMIAQLRNQDPFAPMESGEFLGQLAQFGTVSGIEDMRRSFEQLSGTMAGNQALQAAGLVDREVLVQAREGWLPPEGTLAGAVDVPFGVQAVSVAVHDLSGRLVTTLPVDAGMDGRSAFSWDGRLPDGGRAAPGFYELRAVGNADGTSVALSTMVSGRVESVAIGTAGRSLALTVTGLGVIDFGDIRNIR